MKKSLIYITAIALLTGCGGSSGDKTKIDIASYLPSKSQQRSYLQTTQGDGSTLIKENIVVENKVITIKDDNQTTKTFTVEEDTIIVNDKINDRIKSYKRFISVGSNLYSSTIGPIKEEKRLNGMLLATETTEIVKKCNLDSKIENLNDYSINYSGDILKFKCTETKTVTTKVEDNLPDYINLKDGTVQEGYDISYFYMKKDIGTIVDINDNCIVEQDNSKVTDDSIKECTTGTKEYVYKLLLGE